MSREALILVLLGIAFLFYLLWPTPRKKKTRLANKKANRPKKRTAPRETKDDPVPPNAIVVDGSNVMHWGGTPSAKVLVRVIKALEKKGFAPILIFDASVGYRLSDAYMNAKEMSYVTGITHQQVYVVEKGVVADEVILGFATKHHLRVVSNDRFRDWVTEFPLVGQKGRLVKGDWKEGSVMLPSL